MTANGIVQQPVVPQQIQSDQNNIENQQNGGSSKRWPCYGVGLSEERLLNPRAI